MLDCVWIDVGHAMHARALAGLGAGVGLAETAVAVLLELAICDTQLGDDHAALDVGFASRELSLIEPKCLPPDLSILASPVGSLGGRDLGFRQARINERNPSSQHAAGVAHSGLK